MLDNLKAKVTDDYVFFLRGPLSQWVTSPFEDLYGTEFTCCEQYMMYEKAKLFRDEAVADQILATTSPFDQKKFGRMVAGFNESVWQQHRERIVYQGNLFKFSQNENLKELLLATEQRELVEVNPRDKIWGIGLTVDDPRIYVKTEWKGQNLLGKALMDVRDVIRGRNAN